MRSLETRNSRGFNTAHVYIRSYAGATYVTAKPLVIRDIRLRTAPSDRRSTAGIESFSKKMRRTKCCLQPLGCNVGTSVLSLLAVAK